MLVMEQVRRRKGLSQAAVARACGISDATINKVERKAIPAYPKYREAIKKALDWEGDASELFEEVETPSSGYLDLNGCYLGSTVEEVLENAAI